MHDQPVAWTIAIHHVQREIVMIRVHVQYHPSQMPDTSQPAFAMRGPWSRATVLRAAPNVFIHLQFAVRGSRGENGLQPTAQVRVFGAGLTRSVECLRIFPAVVRVLPILATCDAAAFFVIEGLRGAPPTRPEAAPNIQQHCSCTQTHPSYTLPYSPLFNTRNPPSTATGTTVVADSGDFATIKKYQPQDATTNPSLILAASKKEEYAKLIDAAVEYGKKRGGKNIEEQVEATLDNLLVQFGKEILQIVPGKVSTEVDARFSFDTKASVEKALHIIELYKEVGISKDRVLIKIASTWEGIKAAEILQRDHGINTNLTLMFSQVQAIAAAEAGAFLISPFVGRILDWYKASTKKEYKKEEDPGVKSVQQIFNYYKKHGYKTIVMGASFRSVGEVTELAGCDYLTIAPNLLEELYNSNEDVPQKLIAEDATKLDIPKKSYINNEPDFRFYFNEDQMAVEKLREGISKFAADAVTLKDILRKKIQG
ncbi:hypothetical protein LEMA_P031940.1 [Plenodomus lingam JN3]|uniref:Transaldolase n=1 Tax=Leptosphaeria maculans (strain JN3 / isolate v23.1.3 / race Av1-4-5-6-7-8) TaxID=985895 RepID=E4ZWR6_LEPMJ|nr:hypothetical protein LEMA_P031940.1 [Plenodomus lingam JN3]CBX96042.1 hypothetical protein LEMA_P031940.1 [Plenodomus lingam JN3]